MYIIWNMRSFHLTTWQKYVLNMLYFKYVLNMVYFEYVLNTMYFQYVLKMIYINLVVDVDSTCLITSHSGEVEPASSTSSNLGSPG